MSVGRAGAGNPPVVGKAGTIRIANITGTEVDGELGRLENTIAWLRFRYKSEKKKNDYETRLLQVLSTLPISYNKKTAFFKRRYER